MKNKKEINICKLKDQKKKKSYANFEHEELGVSVSLTLILSTFCLTIYSKFVLCFSHFIETINLRENQWNCGKEFK